MKNQPLNEDEVASFPYRGACLCGRVRFAFRDIGQVVICHCEQCRKAQGAAFACNVPVRKKSFRLTRGSESLKSFRSSAEKSRVFCKNCGSPLWSIRDGAADIRVRTGALNSKQDIQPGAHIFANSCPRWAPIDDSLPQYGTWEPGRR